MEDEMQPSWLKKTMSIPLAFLLIGIPACDQAPPESADSAGVAGEPGDIGDGELVEMSAEELTILNNTPKPEPGERIIGASASTKKKLGIGFWAVKKGRFRGFSPDGKKVVGSATLGVTSHVTNNEKVKATFTIGSKKLTVNLAAKTLSSGAIEFSGDAGGKKFKVSEIGGDVLSGKPPRTSGTIGALIAAMSTDLAGVSAHQEQLCGVGLAMVGLSAVLANPLLAVVGALVVAGEC
jgi:hypothetical protein